MNPVAREENVCQISLRSFRDEQEASMYSSLIYFPCLRWRIHSFIYSQTDLMRPHTIVLSMIQYFYLVASLFEWKPFGRSDWHWTLEITRVWKIYPTTRLTALILWRGARVVNQSHNLCLKNFWYHHIRFVVYNGEQWWTLLPIRTSTHDSVYILRKTMWPGSHHHRVLVEEDLVSSFSHMPPWVSFLHQ